MSAKVEKEIPYRQQFKFDVVKFDGRLKEVIRSEKLTRKQWERKWGFSRDIMKMYYDEVKAAGIRLTQVHCHPWWLSNTEVEVSPSPPVPITSSGFIGWRSGDGEFSLERFGPLYISPRLTMEPPEDCPQSKQINIFIG